MTKPLRDPRRLARLLGWVLILAAWGVLLGFAVGGVYAYRIYADIKAPARSHLTAGTPAEALASTLYIWRYRPIWQSRSDCAVFDEQLEYVPKPATVQFRGPEFDTTIHVTPELVRAQPPAPSAAPLVVVTGDSYAFGWGVEDNQTFSYLLQHDYGYHTVNTAVPSYGTARELSRLRRLGLLKHIDALIIQFCDNDWDENERFLADPAHCGTWSDIRGDWAELQSYRQRPVTYFNVVGDIARFVRFHLQRTSVSQTLHKILTQRPLAFGQSPPRRAGLTGAKMAEDFVAVLDHFPELKDVPVLVTEMVPNDGYTGFTDTLRRLVKDRPNVIPVAIRYVPADYYRFDNHLTPRGQRTAAVQLAAALKRALAGRTASDAAAHHPGF